MKNLCGILAQCSLLISLLWLSACGFQPLYGNHNQKNTDIHTAFDQIEIAVIPNREGQDLRNMLMDRLYSGGRPVNAAYALEIDPIHQRITDLDITKSADATRAQLRLSTNMSLRSRNDGDILLERELAAITSFNVLDSRYTTRVSEQYARESALGQLAEQAERYLALYFNRR